jgi:hypothetical protein
VHSTKTCRFAVLRRLPEPWSARLTYENFNLRTTVSLGVSYLLSNLYGAPSGSLGPYIGVSPLGVEWNLSRAFFFVINPLNIAVPVPQIKGAPLAYPQYRFSLGLEAYLG